MEEHHPSWYIGMRNKGRYVIRIGNDELECRNSCMKCGTGWYSHSLNLSKKEKTEVCTLLGLMVEQKEKMALDLHLTISRKGMDAEGDSVSEVG